MAIVTEQFEINGKAFTKTYSNAYRYVVRDGASYVEANDPSEFGRTYTEGDVIEEYTKEAKAENALSVLLGEIE